MIREKQKNNCGLARVGGEGELELSQTTQTEFTLIHRIYIIDTSKVN